MGATPLAGGPPRGELSRAGWQHLAGGGRVRTRHPHCALSLPQAPLTKTRGQRRGCVPESSGLLSVCPLPVSHLVGTGFAPCLMNRGALRGPHLVPSDPDRVTFRGGGGERISEAAAPALPLGAHTRLLSMLLLSFQRGQGLC